VPRLELYYQAEDENRKVISVRVLRLLGTQIGDDGLSELSTLSNLENLNIGFTGITDDGLIHLAKLHRLKELHVNGTRVTNAGMEHLLALEQLCAIDIRETKVDDTGIERLKPLEKIESIWLNASVTDKGLVNLAEFRNLRIINTFGARVTDESLLHLAKIKGLRFLVLTNAKVTAEGVEKLRKALRQCRIEVRPTIQAELDRDTAQVPSLANSPFDAEQAKKYQQAWADYIVEPVERDVELSSGVKMGFVLIPPGEFMMGSSKAEQDRFLEKVKAPLNKGVVKREDIDLIRQEELLHRVQITKPFRLSRHEVTRGQFRQFVMETGYKTESEQDGRGGTGLLAHGRKAQSPQYVWNADLGFPQTDDHPVVNVTWNDATAFCLWLSKKQGSKYHLPTEAQWEYACRAGTTTVWYCGDSDTTLHEYGCFSPTGSNPAGQLKPNAWGLYDMHSNVWEWTADIFASKYYTRSPINDPKGLINGSDYAGRGGGWHLPTLYSRSANRRCFSADSRFCYLGFRVAEIMVSKRGKAEVGSAPGPSSRSQTAETAKVMPAGTPRN